MSPSSDEKGTERMAGKTKQDLRLQIKSFSLSMRLLDTLRYTQGTVYGLIPGKLEYPCD
jgi:hypothetical protein